MSSQSFNFDKFVKDLEQRESMSDRKRVEVQKFKSELNKVVTGAQAQQKVNTERTKRQQEQQVQAGLTSLMSEDIGE